MRLGVNVDHIATVRQARRGTLPDPVDAALVCEQAGAQSVVCHLREDRRHIHDDDVRRLKQAITTRLNLEMSLARDIIDAALAIQPHQVTLVPERRQELTTEGGLDVVKLSRRVRQAVGEFQERGIDVSLFVDPVLRQLEAAKGVGSRLIELHTGRYANAASPSERAQELEALKQAASQGRELGLIVAAGHGLDYENIQGLMGIAEIEEVNIGFSIISRALAVGLAQAVREMVVLIAAHAKSPQAHVALETA